MIPGQKESIADALAVLAVSRRDETAWATLYKQMWPFVRAIAYRRLGSVEGLADDAAQEVFARLGFTHICGKNGLGRFLVRRTTIRKRMRTKLREVKQQLRKRMHDSVPKPEDGSSRLCKATSTTTRYQETSRPWVYSAIGCSRSGGVPFAAGVRNAGSTGRASLFWLTDGFPNRARSIPFLMLALPLVIRDKNRMR